MENNIETFAKETNERFTVDEKNLWMMTLKRKLGFAPEESIPNGLSGFINAYKEQDFEEIKRVSEESKLFLTILTKLEKEGVEKLTKKELVTLGIFSSLDEIEEKAPDLAYAKNIESNKENKSNIWFQKGLQNVVPDMTKSLAVLNQRYEERKDTLEADKEYNLSIIEDYEKRLAFLESFNLPEGYTVDAVINKLVESKKEADTMLTPRKKVA